ncbi:MAG: hypothetical protein JWQ04_3097 [Pedosphaera sp.]|nr:hypothetical protein [Pedosphaera sp.]
MRRFHSYEFKGGLFARIAGLLTLACIIAGCAAQHPSPETAQPSQSPISQRNIAPDGPEPIQPKHGPPFNSVRSFPLQEPPPLAAYDAMLVKTIKTHWYNLLDKRDFPGKTGKVILEFHLHADGQVSNLKVLESDVGNVRTYVCTVAVKDPAPYMPWPSEVRRIVGSDDRVITFTFNYE